MHHRLLFALCRSCCEEMRQDDCNHENSVDREFTGIWVADELRKAIELGYHITNIYIIWQYEITCFEQATGEGGLFSDYVNTFLKIKQQASGWPSSCLDEASKLRYLHEYERDEGIKLEREKIEKNAGLRAVAKLCLNSFWGKFGQRSNLNQTTVVKTRENLLRLLFSPEKEVFDIILINDENLYVNWRLRDEAVEAAPNTNVVLAAYTTAQARLKLYSYLEKLGRRTLYYDTDSCIFICNERAGNAEYSPPLGSLLGDMTNELKGEDTYIETFLSGGPKFYSYRTVNPNTREVEECCKVKGIRLNFINSLKINFESIKSLIDNHFTTATNNSNNRDEEEGTNAIEINFNSISRTKTHDVVTRKEFKTCSIVLKKRRYISQKESLPFGYKHN